MAAPFSEKPGISKLVNAGFSRLFCLNQLVNLFAQVI